MLRGVSGNVSGRVLGPKLNVAGRVDRLRAEKVGLGFSHFLAYRLIASF